MTSEGRPAKILLVQDDVADELFLRVQNLSVQGYVRKPVDFDALTEIVRSQRALGYQVRRRRWLRRPGCCPPRSGRQPHSAASLVRQ